MRSSLFLLVPLLLGAQNPPTTPPPAPPSTTPPPQSSPQTPAATKPADAKPADQAATPPATPEQGAKAATEAKFDAAHLEQIVAPIALHPDGLLSQILMASTYPLEIVEAARWREKNPSLKEKALEDALKTQDWDASVKSLCGFPSVLKQMNENLDWTQDLGDAFLGQKAELMEAVQRMRKKALDAGQLKTNDQQKVTQEGQYIVVQSTNPEVIYVPTYSPTVVYGGWAYPTYYYPPMYAPYPPGAGFISFTAGVVWGAAIFGNCNWGGSDVDIDINNENNFNGRTGDREQRERAQGGRDSAGTRDSGRGGAGSDRAGAKGGKESFKHNPEHRKGVNYKDSGTASKFGGESGSKRVSKDQARGFSGSGGASARNTAGSSTRPSGGSTRPSSPSSRADGGGAGSARAGSSSRPSTSGAGSSSRSRPSTSGSGGSKSSAFSGSRNAGLDRAASSRGSSSRGGGGARGGGGRGGGGRGGGRR
jgi:hypothetical protein